MCWPKFARNKLIRKISQRRLMIKLSLIELKAVQRKLCLWNHSLKTRPNINMHWNGSTDIDPDRRIYFIKEEIKTSQCASNKMYLHNWLAWKKAQNVNICRKLKWFVKSSGIDSSRHTYRGNGSGHYHYWQLILSEISAHHFWSWWINFDDQKRS